MLPKYLFYLAFGTLLISGCGLETDDDDDETSYVEVSVEQNVYLPLTNATRFYYSSTGGTTGDLEANISYDVGMSNAKGYPVYKVAIDGTGLTLDLYFRTTTSQIELLGIDGPVDVGDADIDYLRFSTPIKLVGAQTNQSTSASAEIEISGDPLPNPTITMNYSVANRTNIKFENNGFIFPTLNATLTAEITVTSSIITTDPIPVVLDFYFTKGLGLVQHSGNLTENSTEDYEVKFHRLLGLPNVMSYDAVGNGPSHFTMADSGDNLSSSDYRILNQAELNSMGWITISTDANADWKINVEDNASTPDTLTSYQVLFEDKHSDERLSGNITIVISP
ncbi:MAG: hypothetical protein CMK89_19695 [Pseudomonadales bacterium]|nr:hypothetical protein [Pseudomonadales bacterium]